MRDMERKTFVVREVKVTFRTEGRVSDDIERHLNELQPHGYRLDRIEHIVIPASQPGYNPAVTAMVIFRHEPENDRIMGPVEDGTPEWVKPRKRAAKKTGRKRATAKKLNWRQRKKLREAEAAANVATMPKRGRKKVAE